MKKVKIKICILILSIIWYYSCKDFVESSVTTDENDINLPGEIIYEGINSVSFPRFLSNDSIIFSDTDIGEMGGFTEVKILDIKESTVTNIYRYPNYSGQADYKNNLLLVSRGQEVTDLIQNDSILLRLHGQGAAFNSDGSQIAYERIQAYHPIVVFSIADSSEEIIYPRGLRPDWDGDFIYFQRYDSPVDFAICRINVHTNKIDSLTETLHEAWHPRAHNGYFVFMQGGKQTGDYNFYTLIYKDTTKLLEIKDAYYPDIYNKKVVYVHDKKLYIYSINDST